MQKKATKHNRYKAPKPVQYCQLCGRKATGKRWFTYLYCQKTTLCAGLYRQEYFQKPKNRKKEQVKNKERMRAKRKDVVYRKQEQHNKKIERQKGLPLYYDYFNDPDERIKKQLAQLQKKYGRDKEKTIQVALFLFERGHGRKNYIGCLFDFLEEQLGEDYTKEVFYETLERFRHIRHKGVDKKSIIHQ